MNNNNNINLIPFSLESFSLSDFKRILEYHCVFKNDSPYEVNLYDSNKNSLDKSFEFEAYFKIPLDESNPEYDLSLQDLKKDIVAVCTWWGKEFAHSLPDCNLYYMDISGYYGDNDHDD